MFKNTLFSTLLKLVPRTLVQESVKKYASDYGTKKFKTWHHLVAMLYGQLGGFDSLRTMESTFSRSKWASYHLGGVTLKRSTLSDANKTRSADVFEDICHKMMRFVPRQTRRDLKGMIRPLDSTPIVLRGRGHGWARATAIRSQELKVHLGLCAQTGDLWMADITQANINDVTVAQSLSLEEGRIYVFDKGYCDYNWWHAIDEKNAFFVTRLKKKAAFKTFQELSLAPEDSAVVRDRLILLTNNTPRWKSKNLLAGKVLRLVDVRHPTKKGEVLHIVTNRITEPAQVIGDLYKKRWAIELLFKFLKQNLKMKRFIGENKNAIKIQLYTALISYMVLLLFHRLGKQAGRTFHETVVMIRYGLMQLMDRLTEGIGPQRMTSTRQLTLSWEKAS